MREGGRKEGKLFLFSFFSLFFLTRSNSVPLPATPAPAGTPVLSWSMSEERRSSPSSSWEEEEEAVVVEKEEEKEVEVVGVDEKEKEFGAESKKGASARRRSRGLLLRRRRADITVVAIDSTAEMTVNVGYRAARSERSERKAQTSEFPIAGG